MRRFLESIGGVAAFLLAIAAAAVVIPVDRVATGGTTLTGQLTIPSPTTVMPGPLLTGQPLKIGEAIAVGFDPRVSGWTRPAGSIVYVKDGSSAYIKYGSSNTAWELLGSAAFADTGNAAAIRTARAATLTGISASLLTCFREDFVDFATGGSPFASLAVGTGNVAGSTTVANGRAELTSGATAASIYILASGSTVIGPPATNRMYFGTRMAVTSTVDAQTFAVSGIQVAGFAAGVNLGVCGNSSTVNYVFQYDSTDCAGTFLSTGQPINTSYHVFEIWTVADGKYHAAVDGVEIAGSPVTPASPPASPLRLITDVRNGTTATARTIGVDWWHACWSET